MKEENAGKVGRKGKRKIEKIWKQCEENKNYIVWGEAGIWSGIICLLVLSKKRKDNVNQTSIEYSDKSDQRSINIWKKTNEQTRGGSQKGTAGQKLVSGRKMVRK